MTINLESSLVRIEQVINRKCIILGTGFLVESGLVVTCTHVVSQDGKKLHPGLHIIHRLSGTAISIVSPPIFIGNQNESDIAIFRIDGALPPSAAYLKFGPSMGSDGHRFQTFGYPSIGNIDGLPTEGTISGQTRRGIGRVPLIHFKSTTVAKGFSGAPLFDQNTGQVIGIISDKLPGDGAGRLGDSCFAIASEEIKKIHPSVLWEETNPYRGLLPFVEANVKFFAGRKGLIEELADQVRVNPRFLALIGPSGSGKTSVIRAGLIPRLIEHPLLDCRRLRVVTFRPEISPAQALKDALVTVACLPPVANENVWTYLDRVLAEDEDAHWVLFCDQFEALFTTVSKTEQSEFFTGVTRMIESARKTSLVVASRNDFYHQLAASPLGPYLKSGQINIRRMSAQEMQEAIEEPARKVSLCIEDGLANVIMDDLFSSPHALSLLQFTLEQLWIARENNRLTRSAYKRIGGAAGALGQWATRMYHALELADQALVRRILFRLIHVGANGTPDVPRAISIERLAEVGNPANTRWLIDTLCDARILTTDDSPIEGATVEIINAALLTEWKELKAWIGEDFRRFLIWRQHVQSSLETWTQSQNPDALLRGAFLQEAADWQKKYPDEFTLNESQYVRSSFRHKRIRRLMDISVFAALLVSFLLIIDNINGQVKNQRRIADIEKAVEDSLAHVQEDRDALQRKLSSSGGIFELLSRPGEWQSLIERAQANLSRARALQTSAEGKANPDLESRIKQFENLLQRDEEARELAVNLEKIRSNRATVVRGGFNYTVVNTEYSEVFAVAGLGILDEDLTRAVGRVELLPIKEQVLAALDDWAWVAFKLGNDKVAERLLSVARAIAPDPAWGNQIRQVKTWRDQEALTALLKNSPPPNTSPPFLVLIGVLIDETTFVKQTWLRQARDRFPNDFWLNLELANALSRTDLMEAIGFGRVAIALRPDSSAAYFNLAIGLHEQKKLPEAIASYTRATELDNRFAEAFMNLGNAYFQQGDWSRAAEAYQKATKINPNYAEAYFGLGNAYRQQEDWSNTITSFRRATKLDDGFAKAFMNLGNAYFQQGDWSGAAEVYQKATKIDPNYAEAHFGLGNVYYQQENWVSATISYEKAIKADPTMAKAYRQLGLTYNRHGKPRNARNSYDMALRIDPKFAEAHVELGLTLQGLGEMASGYAAIRHGDKLGRERGDWKSHVDVLSRAERLANLENRLAAILSGKEQPASAAERLEFAQVCHVKGLYAASVRLYEQAFAADTKLANDLKAGNRLHAACAACLLAAGQGKDSAKLDDKQRATWRRQAVAWLNADLAICAKQVESIVPQDRIAVYQYISLWQKDDDLACIRDPAALANIPGAERAACQEFWKQVELILNKATDKP